MSDTSIEESMLVVEEVVRESATGLLRLGVAPRPQVHLFSEHGPTKYMGYIVPRNYYQGRDAFDSIAALGTLAAVLGASRLLVAWELADLEVSVFGPGDYPPWLMLVDAATTQHALIAFPLLMEFTPSPTGIESVAPTGFRIGARSHTVGGALPASIDQLLVNWRTPLSFDPNYVLAMEELGYELRLTR